MANLAHRKIAGSAKRNNGRHENNRERPTSATRPSASSIKMTRSVRISKHKTANHGIKKRGAAYCTHRTTCDTYATRRAHTAVISARCARIFATPPSCHSTPSAHLFMPALPRTLARACARALRGDHLSLRALPTRARASTRSNKQQRHQVVASHRKGGMLTKNSVMT